MIMKNKLLSTLFALITTLGFSQAPNYVPTNGLVGWWPFNGNADDESGNGNNGSNNGATLNSDRFGSNNSCYYFQNNNILIPHNTLFGFQANSGFTISMWCNSSDFSNSLHFMGKRGDSSPYFNWQIAYGGNLIGPNFGSGTDPGIYNGAFSPDLLLINNWYHIVGKFNNGVWSIYVDGILKATNTTAMVNPDSNTPMTFGESGGFQGFIGKLDDIGIWNRALTDCEIQNLYTSTNPTNTTAASACGSYAWNGQTYTQSGTYTGITENCISQSLNLTITPSSTNTTSASACDSYSWNGQTYSTSGVYTGTTTNCVTESLNLTITPSSTNTTTATSCDSYTWNGQAYTQSGVYTGTTANCVTESLNLTITPSSTNTTTASACGSYAWNGQTYTQSGTYTGITENCISQSLNLTITPSSTNTTTAATCDSYIWNGTTYSASGVYTGTTTNCVTEFLNLTITPSSTNTTTASACNSYVWNGTSYSASGVYTGTTANCVTQALNLTINSSTSSSISQTALDSYTWPANNQSYTTSGAYTAVIPNAVGCDSTITLNLTMSFTGINDINASKISIYPNPTNGDFTITGLELVGTVSSLSLTDMNGKVVKVLDTKATKFSMASIKPGVYFLNIRADNKQEVLKIVKE
jgi:hypothetical protein